MLMILREAKVKKLINIMISKFTDIWTCKCGNTLPDDRNFCVQCDREKP